MTRLAWRSAGESHGPALIGLVEGVPAGLVLDVAAIDAELVRRQGGYGRGGRMRIETDSVELLSGLRAGRTLGSPIAFRIANKDAVIERLPVPTNPRPGHADLAGCQKYGHRDPRAVLERASARETAVRVAAGAVARQVAEALGVEFFAHVVELGGIAVDAAAVERAFADAGDGPAARRAARDTSDFFTLDPSADARMRALVDRCKAEGDTLGGVFEVRVHGLPPGLGGYATAGERLTGRLGGALFSIPAIKGVEFGLGFESARRPGSEVHDAIALAEAAGRPAPAGGGRFVRATNRAGGLEGGMSTGEPLVCRAAMKPIPTLRQGLPTVEFEGGVEVRATYQRSDVTSVPAASVVGEAMAALELTAALLEKLGGDSMDELRAGWAAYRERLERV